MGFLDRLFGAPTLESVARDVTRELRALAVEDLKTDLTRAEMSFRLHGSDVRLYLGNLLHDLQRAPRRERPTLQTRFLQGMLSSAPTIPARYAEVRSLLMPVLRRRGDIGIATLSTWAMAGDKPEPASRPVTKPLVADLVIALVIDRPTSMVYVNGDELPKWGVDFEQALADALDNLRGLPEQGGWQALAPGVWSGEWGDSYDSSRILLPDLIHRVGVRDPVAVVPFRNALMLTSAGNEAGLALMARIVDEHLAENQRWLSFQPLRLVEATWQAWQPPAGEDAWKLLQVRNDASLYAAQKELLDAYHERSGTDIFVANCDALRWDDTRSATYAVWGDGVDTLLPRTDLIAFAWTQPDGEAASLMVPWDAAVGVAGALMEPTAESPERWRLRGFPDAAQRETLAGLALEK